MDLQNLSQDKKRSIYEELKKEFAYIRKRKKSKKDIILEALENKALLFWGRVYYFKEYKDNVFYFENDKLSSYDKKLTVSIREFKLNEEKTKLVSRESLMIIPLDTAEEILNLIKEKNKIHSEVHKEISLIYKERDEKIRQISKEILSKI